MDAMTDKETLNAAGDPAPARPSREEAEEAVRTLLRWAGDDPRREGLLETPKRVAKAYEDWFRGYHEDPHAILGKRFEDVQGYDDMVMLTNIDVESHCEHHMAPILGTALRGLSARPGRCGHLQDRQGRGSLFQAASNPGDDDRADRRRH